MNNSYKPLFCGRLMPKYQLKATAERCDMVL